MARKGKEIQLQQEIETQEEWEDMLSKEGLCVVDAYSEWCCPCLSMIGLFRKVKNELGDSLLIFAIAKADTIDALEKYRGHCEPCFLFYAGGVLVAVVRGANAPLILRTITEQLAQEHKVLDGQAERKEIKDTRIAELEQQGKEVEEEEEVEAKKPKTPSKEPVKEVSVVIIKPDAVQSGKADEIMAEMKKRGIEILQQEERQLTEDEVRNVYTHLQDEPFFTELVAFMTKSPCIVLAITKGKTGENIINEFRELIGPTEVEQAKEQAPDSLRAKYGQEGFMNAVHGSDSKDTAARELAFFFPDFAAPKVEGPPKIQRTLALIRPDAYKKNKDEILAKIREAGFKVAMSKEIHLNKEQAEEFYKEHKGQEYFDELTDRMSSGPMLALGLAREDAISKWREMLGPTKVDDAKEQNPESLRAQFVEEGAQINMLHGSDSEAMAQKELEYFFPMEQTVAVIKPDAIGTKDEIIDKIHEAGFRIAARKEQQLTKEIAEEFYADHKDKEYYNDLVEHMSSGPTLFMVLSREGAVEGWRSMMGPTDPGKAKEADPNADTLLRALYGTDTLKNALHGSSNPEHAKTQIAKIFEENEVAVSESREQTFEQAPEIEREEEGQTTETDEQNVEEGKQEDQDVDAEQKETDETANETTGSPGDESEKTQEDKTEAKEEPKKVEEQAPQPAEGGTSEPEHQEQKQTEEQQSESAPEVQQEQQAEEKTKTPEPATEEKPAETEEKQEEQKPAEEPQKTEEPAQEQQEEAKPEEQAPTEEPKAEEQKTEESSEQKEEEKKEEKSEGGE